VQYFYSAPRKATAGQASIQRVVLPTTGKLSYRAQVREKASRAVGYFPNPKEQRSGRPRWSFEVKERRLIERHPVSDISRRNESRGRRRRRTAKGIPIAYPGVRLVAHRIHARKLVPSAPEHLLNAREFLASRV
jgi:hypothetical protein